MGKTIDSGGKRCKNREAKIAKAKSLRNQNVPQKIKKLINYAYQGLIRLKAKFYLDISF